MDLQHNEHFAGPVIDQVPVIEWDKLNLYRYLPLTSLSSFATRTLVYPFSLIKTRIQAQTHNAQYKGTRDAFVKIYGKEGVVGLYRGLLSQNALIFPSLAYIWTYERVRYFLSEQDKVEFLRNKYLRNCLGGTAAAMAGQTLSVPIENVVQYRQLGHKTKKTHMKALPPEIYQQRFPSWAIVQFLVKSEGPRALWKGYFATLGLVVPSSCIWWGTYGYISDQWAFYLSDYFPMTAIQCSGALSASLFVTSLSNFMDIIRLRIQTERKSFRYTASTLWKEERWRMFYKGLSARLAHNLPFIFTIVLFYESIKKYSIKDEFKDSVKW